MSFLTRRALDIIDREEIKKESQKTKKLKSEELSQNAKKKLLNVLLNIDNLSSSK